MLLQSLLSKIYLTYCYFVTKLDTLKVYMQLLSNEELNEVIFVSQKVAFTWTYSESLFSK